MDILLDVLYLVLIMVLVATAFAAVEICARR